MITKTKTFYDIQNVTYFCNLNKCDVIQIVENCGYTDPSERYILWYKDSEVPNMTQELIFIDELIEGVKEYISNESDSLLNIHNLNTHKEKLRKLINIKEFINGNI